MKRTKIEKTSGFLLESGEFCQTMEEAELKRDEIDFKQEFFIKNPEFTDPSKEIDLGVILNNFETIRSIFKEMWK